MGTGKTGGHWKPCNIGSVEAHNERRPEYLESVKKAGLGLYFFENLTEHNDHWVSDNVRYKGKTVAEVFEAMKKLYKEKTGQLPQLTDKIKVYKKTGKEYKCAGWSPIREMCPPIKENTKIEDFDYLKKWAKKYGIEIIRIDLHKDEGYHDEVTGEYKMNYHAHVVASFLDWNTGKTVKPNSQAMSEMQTILAMALDMERGERKADTGKQYLDQVQYREMMEAIDGEKKREKVEVDKIKAQQNEESKKLETLKIQTKQAETRLKGLTTMLTNLEAQKDAIEIDIAALEDEYGNGKKEAEEKLDLLKKQLTEINKKIEDKNKKLSAATDQFNDLAKRNMELEDQILSLSADAAKDMEWRKSKMKEIDNAILEKRVEVARIDKSGELNRAYKHIEDRDAVLYRYWPEARNATDAIFRLGNSPTAKDFTPQQALDVEHAIVTSGTSRTDAAKDLLSLARKDFDHHKTPEGWVDGAAKVVRSIAQGTHQRLTALLNQQSKDAGGGPSYITDLTDWAGNQVKM